MGEGMLRIPRDGDSIAASVSRDGTLVNIADVTKDSRFKASNIKDQSFKTHNMIVVPVVIEDKVVAVIQLLNKKDPQGNYAAFVESDERMLKMMTKHTSIFMEQL